MSPVRWTGAAHVQSTAGIEMPTPKKGKLLAKSVAFEFDRIERAFAAYKHARDSFERAKTTTERSRWLAARQEAELKFGRVLGAVEGWCEDALRGVGVRVVHDKEGV